MVGFKVSGTVDCETRRGRLMALVPQKVKACPVSYILEEMSFLWPMSVTVIRYLLSIILLHPKKKGKKKHYVPFNQFPVTCTGSCLVCVPSEWIRDHEKWKDLFRSPKETSSCLMGVRTCWIYAFHIGGLGNEEEIRGHRRENVVKEMKTRWGRATRETEMPFLPIIDTGSSRVLLYSPLYNG